MNELIIERALACRLIDQYMKKNDLSAPLTDEHLAGAAWHILELLRCFEVRAMFDENTFHGIDVERTELYGFYLETLARRYFDARYDKNVFGDPLTEEHICDLIGDFQDLIWNSYGDDAIQCD